MAEAGVRAVCDRVVGGDRARTSGARRVSISWFAGRPGADARQGTANIPLKPKAGLSEASSIYQAKSEPWVGHEREVVVGTPLQIWGRFLRAKGSFDAFGLRLTRSG